MLLVAFLALSVVSAAYRSQLESLPIELFNHIIDLLDPLSSIRLLKSSKNVLNKAFDIDSVKVDLIRRNATKYIDRLVKSPNLKPSRKIVLFFKTFDWRSIQITKEVYQKLSIIDYKHWRSPFTQALKTKRIDLDNEAAYDVFEFAITLGNLEVVKLLLKDYKIDPSVNRNFAIINASRRGYTKLVEFLLSDNRVDPSAGVGYAIRSASENGHLNVVMLLLEHPMVDPSAGNNYAIRKASRNGHWKVIELLLKSPSVNPSDLVNEAIISAIESGHCNVVRVLLNDSRTDPSFPNNMAIQKACANGNIEIVQLLLDHPKVDPAFGNNQALKAAYQANNFNVIQLLLTDKRVNPFHHDSYTQSIDIVKTLLNSSLNDEKNYEMVKHPRRQSWLEWLFATL